MRVITKRMKTVLMGDIELRIGRIVHPDGDVYGKAGEWSDQRYIELNTNNCQISYNGTFIVDSGAGNRPVVEVTWYGVKSFALYYGLDLPTEAEWEYACRGGQQLKYGTDDGTINNTNTNYNIIVGHTTDVGSYPSNPFGLYNMCGNVKELCHDWFGAYTSVDAINPSGPQSGANRLVRGGSWGSSPQYCRAACRDFSGPKYGADFIGFRVVRRPGGLTY